METGTEKRTGRRAGVAAVIAGALSVAAVLVVLHGSQLRPGQVPTAVDTAATAEIAAQAKFFARNKESVVNHYTASKTGCKCPFDPNSNDCACCANGGLQCGKANPHECVADGQPDDCGLLHNTYLPGFKWSITTKDVDKDGWGPCQPGCGASIKYRNIYCIREDGTIVDATFCDSSSKPDDTVPCDNYDLCTPQWEVTEWSDCGAACGSSSQARSVFCKYEQLDQVVEDELCPEDQKPDKVQVCQEYSLCEYAWQTSCEGQETWCEWKDCDAQCGAGTEKREVKCSRFGGDTSPTYVDAEQIPASHNFNSCRKPGPLTQRECWSDEGCNFIWAGSEWSKCEAECGEEGTQTREIGCMRAQPGTDPKNVGKLLGGATVEDELCSTGTKPGLSQSCFNNHMCEYHWSKTSWLDCPDGCGNMQQTRQVQCVRGPREHIIDLVDSYDGVMTGKTVEWSPKFDLAIGTVVFKVSFVEFQGTDAVVLARRAENGFVVYLTAEGKLGIQPTADFGVVTGECESEDPIAPDMDHTVAVQWSTMEGQTNRIVVDGKELCSNKNKAAWSWNHPSHKLPWELGWSTDDSFQQDKADITNVHFYDGRVKGYTDVAQLKPHYVPARDNMCDARTFQRASSGFYTLVNKASGRKLGDAGGNLQTYVEVVGALAGTVAPMNETVFELQEASDGTFAVYDQKGQGWWYADDYGTYQMQVTEDDSKKVDPFARFHMLKQRDGSYKIVVHGSNRWLREDDAADGQHEIFTTNELEDDSAYWYIQREVDHEWWHLIMKLGADDTFRYSSPYWTNDEVLNVHDDTKPNRKLASFSNVKFDMIRGCVGSPRSNCITYKFANVWESAQELFKAGYVKKVDLERTDFDRVFVEEPKECTMQMPGFNVMGNKGKLGGNKVRWGYLNNAPSQPCDYEDGADSDSAIGFGVEAQNLASERQNGAVDALSAYGAGYGGYFNSDTADATNPGTALEAWIYVADSSVDSAGYCMSTAHMRLSVVDHNTAPRMEIDEENELFKTNGGLPETMSALGPFYGRRTWFVGTAKGGPNTYMYKMVFDYPATISSINLVGSGFKDTTIQLLDEEKDVLSETAFSELDCSAGDVCEVNIAGSNEVGTVFYLKESNGNELGRLRSSICVHAESELVVPVEKCTASSEHSDHPCDAAFDSNAETAWATDGEGVGSWMEVEFAERHLISELRYQQFFSAENANKEIEVQFMDGDNIATRIIDLDSDYLDIKAYTFSPAWADRIKLVVRSVYGTINNGAAEIQYIEHIGAHVLNGGFEALPSEDSKLYSTETDNQGLGWVVASGDVKVGQFGDSVPGEKAEGLQIIDMSGTQAGTIYQDLALTKGNMYVLRFAASGNFNTQPDEKTMQVYWGNELVDDITIDASRFSQTFTPWAYYQYTLVAPGGVVRIKFVSTVGTAGGVLVDNVVVFDGGRPADTQTCEARTAGICVCSWSKLTPWTEIECSETCGAGVKTREAQCLIDMQGDDFHGDVCPTIPGQSACAPAIAANQLSVPCNNVDGCTFEYAAAEWGEDTCPAAGNDDNARDKLCPGACPRTCGEAATKMRDVACHKRAYKDGCGSDLIKDLGPVPDSNCEVDGGKDMCGEIRPLAEMSCKNFEACSTRWECTEWSPCHADCGSSQQMRRCNCWRSDGTNDVDAQFCKDAGLDTPALKQTCNSYTNCNYVWHVENKSGQTYYGPGHCDESFYLPESKSVDTTDIKMCHQKCSALKKCGFYAFNGKDCRLYSQCAAKGTPGSGLTDKPPGFETYTVDKQVAGTDRIVRWCNLYVNQHAYGDGFMQGGNGDRLKVNSEQFGGEDYGFTVDEPRDCFDTCHSEDGCQQAVFKISTGACYLHRHKHEGFESDKGYHSLGCFSGTCQEMVDSAFAEVMCAGADAGNRAKHVEDCQQGLLSKAQLVQFLRGSEQYQAAVGDYTSECSKSCDQMVVTSFREALCREVEEDKKAEYIATCQRGEMDTAKMLSEIRGGADYSNNIGSPSNECSDVTGRWAATGCPGEAPAVAYEEWTKDPDRGASKMFDTCEGTRDSSGTPQQMQMCLGHSGQKAPQCCLEQNKADAPSCTACPAPFVAGTWEEQSSSNKWELSQNGCSFVLQGKDKTNAAAKVEGEFKCVTSQCAAKVTYDGSSLEITIVNAGELKMSNGDKLLKTIA